MRTDGSRREPPAAQLLRELTRGLSAHRLFPGEADRPAFVKAAERIGAAASEVLGDGPFEVEVRGGRFHDRDGPVPGHDDHGLLARILYAQGVERLAVIEPPGSGELVRFYTELTDVDAADKRPLVERLSDAEVKALAVGELTPLPALSPDEGPVGDDTDWGLLVDAAELAEVAPGDDATARAAAVLERIREVVAVRPEGIAGDARSIGRLRRAVAALPPEIRRHFYRLVVTERDEVASVVQAEMSDADLADALVTVAGEGGGDPLDLARELVESGQRREVLVALTQAAVDQARGSGATGGATVDAADGEVAGSPAATLLARGTKIGEQRAVPDLVAGVAATTAAASDSAVTALSDYLLLDPGPAPARRVLRGWAAEVREAVVRGDAETVAALSGAVASAARSDADVSALVEEARELALDAGTVAELLSGDLAAELDDMLPLLEPLGGVAMDRVFAVLAEEESRTRRVRLLDLVTRLAAGHVERLDHWLSDGRWYVVRNAVCVLEEVGDDEAVDRLRRAVTHGDQRVRREAMRALAGLSSVEAVRVLARLARSASTAIALDAINGLVAVMSEEVPQTLASLAEADDRPLEVREEALEKLASYPSDRRTELLDRLSSRRRGGLPWRLRRQARSLLEDQGGTR